MVRLTNLDFNVSRDLAMTGGTIDSNFQLFDPSDGVYTFRFSVDTNATVENVSPTLFDGLALWLDANDTGGVAGEWKDKSGRLRHAVANGSPDLISNGFNGLPVMRYSGNNAGTGRDYHDFGKIGSVRTVFWVWKNSGGWYFMLGDRDNSHFHRQSYMFDSTWASSRVKEGTLRLNGSLVSTTSTPFQNQMSIIALRTTGDVSATYFSKDRNRNNDRFANGDLGELVIYDKPLSDSEMSIVESYLSQKWGIGGAPSSSSMITLAADTVQDEYGEGNDFAIALMRKMYRAITKGTTCLPGGPLMTTLLAPMGLLRENPFMEEPQTCMMRRLPNMVDSEEGFVSTRPSPMRV